LPGQRIIDTSTGDPIAVPMIAGWLDDLGVGYLDATVSGSSSQLRAGEAVMFVGASDDSFRSVKSLLDCLSSKVHHIGPPGSGSQMKLVSNLVLGLNRAALAEGLVYAEALGLDLAKTLSLLKQSMAYSKIMDSKGEKMIHREFSPQAKLSQHWKDVRLMLEDSRRTGRSLPHPKTHHDILQQAVEMGLGELDNIAIIEVLKGTFRPKPQA